MIVLGIDPGSLRMGYGVVRVEPAGLVYVGAGVLAATAKYGKYARNVELWRDLQRLLDDYKPDVAAVESGFVSNQMGALVSAGARAIAALACCLRGIGTREYAPSTVKKAVTGHGGSKKNPVTKEMVGEAVRRILGMQRTPGPDAGDALAVAIARATDRSRT